jgi:hypothetical protein
MKCQEMTIISISNTKCFQQGIRLKWRPNSGRIDQAWGKETTFWLIGNVEYAREKNTGAPPTVQKKYGLAQIRTATFKYMLLYSSIYPVCKPLHHRARRWLLWFHLSYDSPLGVPTNLKTESGGSGWAPGWVERNLGDR